jgi:two-component system, NarL family, response regulator DevR
MALASPLVDADHVATQPDPGLAGRVTCLLVDDHEAMRSSLVALVEQEGFLVVGEAGTGAQAVSLLGELKPVLAVLDYRLPDMTGIDIAREAARVAPLTALVLHAGEAPRSMVSEAVAAGIRGVVLKSVPATELMRSVEAVLAGETYVDPRLRDAAWPLDEDPALSKRR